MNIGLFGLLFAAGVCVSVIDIKKRYKDNERLKKTLASLGIAAALGWLDYVFTVLGLPYFYRFGLFPISVAAVIFGPAAGFAAGIVNGLSFSHRFLLNSYWRIGPGGLCGLIIGVCMSRFKVYRTKPDAKTITLFVFIQIAAKLLYINLNRYFLGIPWEHLQEDYFNVRQLSFYGFYIDIILSTTAVVILAAIMQKRGVKLTQETSPQTPITSAAAPPVSVSSQAPTVGVSPLPAAPQAPSANQPPSLDPAFTAILQRIIAERGLAILENQAKCRALLQDYTAGGYKKENRLLLLAIEAGCPGEIARSPDPEITRHKLIHKLVDEFLLNREAAEQIIETLYAVQAG